MASSRSFSASTRRMASCSRNVVVSVGRAGSSWSSRVVSGSLVCRRLFLLEQAFVRLVANGLDRLIQADDVSSPRQRAVGGLAAESAEVSPSSSVSSGVRLGPTRLWPAEPGPADATGAAAPSDDCSLSLCDSSVTVKSVPISASDVSFRERSWAEPPGELVSETPDDAASGLFELKSQQRGGCFAFGRRVEFQVSAAEAGQRQPGWIGKSGRGQDGRKGEPVFTGLKQCEICRRRCWRPPGRPDHCPCRAPRRPPWDRLPPLEIVCSDGRAGSQPGNQRQVVGARVDGHQVLTRTAP